MLFIAGGIYQTHFRPLIFIYIYTASANITPAARDDLHGDICSLLPRERADMEAGGYICEVCTHSSFVTVHNFTLTQHVTQSVFHSVVVSLSLPPLSLSLSLSLSHTHSHTHSHYLPPSLPTTLFAWDTRHLIESAL